MTQRPTQTLLKRLLPLWNELSSLIPQGQRLSLRFLKKEIGLTFLGILRIQLKNWLRNSILMLDSQGAELKCQVRGTKFSINVDYIAKVLHITRPENVDRTPYDERVLQAQNILQVLRPDHKVRSKGSSIGTAQSLPKLTTLKLIMFSNLYPLSNITFINLGRAQFLCDLITGVPIDICAHILQTIGKIAARSATQTNIPFCSLIMKILLREGVRPPTNGKVI